MPKIREKLESGLVDQAPTRTFFWGGGGILCFFCVFCVVFMFPNVSKKNEKLDRSGGGWGLINPSFSRIFEFFLT